MNVIVVGIDGLEEGTGWRRRAFLNTVVNASHIYGIVNVNTVRIL